MKLFFECLECIRFFEIWLQFTVMIFHDCMGEFLFEKLEW